MESMFAHCNNLTEILGLENFDTSKVKNMTSMFYSCSNLQNLNLSNFNTSQVESMGWMFEQCSSLTNLDLSTFNTKNVKIMTRMFYGCKNLTTIYVGDNWDLTNVEDTTDMFTNCGTTITTHK